MRFVNTLNIILLLTFFIASKTSAQSISLYTLNNGGGFNNIGEWSIGESVSIANFISNGYTLNTGVLQPMTGILTGINDYGPVVFGDQITIGPNPTFNLIHVKAIFNEPGNISFQLIDSKSASVLNQQPITIYKSYEKDFVLEKLPSGIFYMKVYFKPTNGKAKTGVYKIIKL
jgi:hypothetical protein